MAEPHSSVWILAARESGQVCICIFLGQSRPYLQQDANYREFCVDPV